MLAPTLINCLKVRAVKSIATAEMVEGRRVLEVTYNAGISGMSSPGFFGLLLEKSERRSKEWLLCTLWSADNWISVNHRWLAAHPRQYQEQRPLHGAEWRETEEGYSVPTGERWDEFQPMVLGQTITSFKCSEHDCKLVLGSAIVEITYDPSTRPLWFGNKEPRQLRPNDDLRNAWVLVHTPAIQT